MGLSEGHKIVGRNYPIYFGEDSLEELDRFIGTVKPARKVFILTDDNVYRHCLPILLNAIPRFHESPFISIRPGEHSKDLSNATRIWEWLNENNASRTDLLINLGGGVVSDLGGFVAGTYKRGMTFVNVPTTLVGQADAAIGGKSGIDFSSIKNNIGLFNNPEAVFIFPGFLDTLPGPELRSGYAEIIKSALVTGGEYWEQARVADFAVPEILEDLIQKAAVEKLALADNDPFDTDTRQALNFGHTVGHALESFSLAAGKSALLHGEAVSVGMVCESFISVVLNGLGRNVLDDLIHFNRKYYTRIDFGRDDLDRVMDFFIHDKKNRGDEIVVTLLEAPGKPVTGEGVPLEIIRNALLFYLEEPEEL